MKILELIGRLTYYICTLFVPIIGVLVIIDRLDLTVNSNEEMGLIVVHAILSSGVIAVLIYFLT